MSDNAALIAKATEWVQEENWESSYETDGFNQPGTDLIQDLATALARAERALTELGTAFRDYKIVHPEGTEDLHRKLAEQAAVIEAIREWNRDADGNGDRDPSDVMRSELTAILSRTTATDTIEEGTR